MGESDALFSLDGLFPSVVQDNASVDELGWNNSP